MKPTLGSSLNQIWNTKFWSSFYISGYLLERNLTIWQYSLFFFCLLATETPQKYLMFPVRPSSMSMVCGWLLDHWSNEVNLAKLYCKRTLSKATWVQDQPDSYHDKGGKWKGERLSVLWHLPHGTVLLSLKDHE
jgi:hypothetical protein